MSNRCQYLYMYLPAITDEVSANFQYAIFTLNRIDKDSIEFNWIDKVPTGVTCVNRDLCQKMTDNV